MLATRNIRRALVFMMVAAAVGLAVTVRVGPPSRHTPPAAPRIVPSNIDVALGAARFSGMRGGSVVWELEADRAEYDRGGSKVFLKGIRMTIEETRGAGQVVLTSDTGEISESSRDVRLKGRVHVQTGSGASFDTESAEYLAARSLVKTDDLVTFRQQRLALKAKGMELDVPAQRCRFLRTVDAVVGR